MTKRINKPTEAPTVLFCDPGRLSGTRVDRASEHCVGIVDDEQGSTGCADDCKGAEAPIVRRCSRHPEDGIIDGELGHDVFAVSEAMQDDSSERRRVKLDGLRGALNP